MDQPPLQREEQEPAGQIGGQIPRITYGAGLVEQGSQLPEQAAGEQKEGGGGRADQGRQPSGGQEQLQQGQNQGPGQKVAEIARQEEPKPASGGGSKPCLVAGVEQNGGRARRRGEGELPPQKRDRMSRATITPIITASTVPPKPSPPLWYTAGAG